MSGYTVRQMPISFRSTWSKFQYFSPCQMSQTLLQTFYHYLLRVFERENFYANFGPVLRLLETIKFFQDVCTFLGVF